MRQELNRSQLVDLVDDLMNGRFATEEQANVALETLDQNVPHPRASNLIFYPKAEMPHLDRRLTAEEIVDAALAYKPIQL